MTITSRLLCLAGATGLMVACSADPDQSMGFDEDGNSFADDLGQLHDKDNDNVIDLFDVNKDGDPDGYGVDVDFDGELDGVALDTDCDGIFDAVDTVGDGQANYVTQRTPPTAPPGCAPQNPGSGGGTASGGGGGQSVASQLGMVESTRGSGLTTERYAEADVFRNGTPYKFIANGWGTQWGSHEISWDGTAFSVLSLTGSQGSDYSPAGYPTVFCGLYSQKQSVGDCGLPASVNSLSSVRTGWRWNSADTGEYNAAWDIWMSTDGTNLSSYLMVWLRDPPRQQPAGAVRATSTTVPGLPGTWQVWAGSVNNRPIVNYVKTEGQDLNELEFDVLDVHRHAIESGYNLPGSHILSVAIGFEVWNGPVSNIQTEDFYVDVR